jgi:hypothetical protein
MARFDYPTPQISDLAGRMVGTLPAVREGSLQMSRCDLALLT